MTRSEKHSGQEESQDKAATTHPRHSTGHARDALALLKEDHARVTGLFEELESAHGGAKRKKLASEICQALTVHAQVEEELFYPRIAAVMKAKGLVAEAGVEHEMIKTLIGQIESEESSDEAQTAARLKVLSEYVKHHIKEEQSEIFREVKDSDLDLKAMGEEMAERFEALRSAKH